MCIRDRVAVRADQARALEHELDGLNDVFIVIVVALADDDIVGVDIVHGDARVVQRHNQPRPAEDVYKRQPI